MCRKTRFDYYSTTLTSRLESVLVLNPRAADILFLHFRFTLALDVHWNDYFAIRGPPYSNAHFEFLSRQNAIIVEINVRNKHQKIETTFKKMEAFKEQIKSGIATPAHLVGINEIMALNKKIEDYNVCFSCLFCRKRRRSIALTPCWHILYRQCIEHCYQ